MMSLSFHRRQTHALVVREKGRHDAEFGREGGRTATMSIKRPEAFYRKLLLKTDVGFAEAFMDGDVTTEDLAELLRVLLDNRDRMADFSSWTGYAAKVQERSQVAG